MVKSETCCLQQVLEDGKRSKLPLRFKDGCLGVLEQAHQCDWRDLQILNENCTQCLKQG